MEVLLIIFWGVITFSILVVLHEGGHFLAARSFGVKVHEFMVGLPGPAMRVKLGETSYGITAVPLGGYVRIAGMEPGPEDALLGDALAVLQRDGDMDADQMAAALGVDEGRAESLLFTLTDWFAVERLRAPGAEDRFRSLMDPKLGDDPETLLDTARKWTYKGLATWKRIVVLAAGVVVNLLAAILVFTVVLSMYGYYEQSMTIEEVVPGSAAASAGLTAGDTIVSIDGTTVDQWPSFTQKLATYDPGDRIDVGYDRDGATRTTQVVLGENEQTGGAFLGVQVGVERVELTPFQAVGQSFVWLGLVFKAIADFFNPQTFETAVEGARSVVGISVEVRNAVREGVLSYAWIVALLSLSLGAMNILPIPPLDGGKIAMELIEKVMGRPVSRNVSLGISVAGTLLLFSLIGYLMYADVVRYIVQG